MTDLSRRMFLRTSGLAGVVGVSGCLRLTENSASSDSEAPSTPGPSNRTFELSASDRFASLDGDPAFFRQHNDILYSIGKSVHAIDTNSQQTLWERELDIASFTANSVSLTDSRIYVGGKTQLYALQRDTGETVWTFQSDAIERERPSVSAIAATEEHVLAGISSASGDDTAVFFALNSADGSQEYHERFDNYLDSIVTHDGIAYLDVSNRSLGYDTEAQATFSTQDRFGMSVGGEMVIHGDRLLARGSGLRILDLQQKSTIFATGMPDFGYIPPVTLDGTIITGGVTGIYGYDIESESEEWHVRTTSTVRVPLLLYNSAVVTADETGVVYVIDPSTGELLYDGQPQGETRVSTLAIVDDTLLFPATDFDTYAIQFE